MGLNNQVSRGPLLWPFVERAQEPRVQPSGSALVLNALPVDGDRRVEDARDAARGPVVFGAMADSLRTASWGYDHVSGAV